MVTEVSGGARNNFSSNLQRQKLATGININAFFFWFQKVTTNYLHKALTKKEGPNVCWNDDKMADDYIFRVRISWQMQKRLNTCLPLCQHPNKRSAQRVIITYYVQLS